MDENEFSVWSIGGLWPDRLRVEATYKCIKYCIHSTQTHPVSHMNALLFCRSFSGESFIIYSFCPSALSRIQSPGAGRGGTQEGLRCTEGIGSSIPGEKSTLLTLRVCAFD